MPFEHETTPQHLSLFGARPGHVHRTTTAAANEMQTCTCRPTHRRSGSDTGKSQFGEPSEHQETNNAASLASRKCMHQDIFKRLILPWQRRNLEVQRSDKRFLKPNGKTTVQKKTPKRCKCKNKYMASISRHCR